MEEATAVARGGPLLRRDKRKFDPQDLPRWGLLHDDRHDSWIEWLERARVSGVAVTDGLVFNDASLMLQAAVDGCSGCPMQPNAEPRSIECCPS